MSALALIASLCPLLVACGSSDEGGSKTTAASRPAAEVAFVSKAEQGAARGYAEPRAATLTIAYSSPNQSVELLKTLGEAIETTTKSLGGSYVELDAHADPDRQVSDLEQLIAREVDGIVVWPLDVKALSPMLKKAQAAGIPVIAVDASPDGSDPGELYASQIIVRRDYIAYLQAQEAASRLGAGASVGTIGFAVPVPSITYWTERAGYWARQFGLDLKGSAQNPSDDIAGGEKAMTELIGKDPDLQGVIAYNEESAVGASAAARAQGKRDLALIGANGGTLGFESVRNEKLGATVQMATPYIGQQAVWGIYDAHAGAEIPRVVLGGEPRVVNDRTLDAVPQWSAAVEALAR